MEAGVFSPISWALRTTAILLNTPVSFPLLSFLQVFFPNTIKGIASQDYNCLKVVQFNRPWLGHEMLYV
jgi:hypothetical protein